MRYNLIGLSGAKGSGKDEVAKMIQSETKIQFNRGEFYDTWRIKRFSQKLKEAVALLFGVTVEQLEDQDFKENMYYHLESGEIRSLINIHPFDSLCLTVDELSESIKNNICSTWVSFRLILQYFGTEVGRNTLGQNFWVNSTFQNYHKDSYWICPDLRFPNELEAIKSRGGLLIRIERPGLDLSDQHSSETSLNDYKNWDEVIVNDSTLEDLREKVKEIVKKYNL